MEVKAGITIDTSAVTKRLEALVNGDPEKLKKLLEEAAKKIRDEAFQRDFGRCSLMYHVTGHRGHLR
jgi:hypothetical protein